MKKLSMRWKVAIGMGIWLSLVIMHNFLDLDVGGAFGTFLMLAVVLYLYFLPTIVAHNRNVKDHRSIFCINLFLGWTLVGWVVALAWALSESAPKCA